MFHAERPVGDGRYRVARLAGAWGFSPDPRGSCSRPWVTAQGSGALLLRGQKKGFGCPSRHRPGTALRLGHQVPAQEPEDETGRPQDSSPPPVQATPGAPPPPNDAMTDWEPCGLPSTPCCRKCRRSDGRSVSGQIPHRPGPAHSQAATRITGRPEDGAKRPGRGRRFTS